MSYSKSAVASSTASNNEAAASTSRLPWTQQRSTSSLRAALPAAQLLRSCDPATEACIHRYRYRTRPFQDAGSGPTSMRRVVISMTTPAPQPPQLPLAMELGSPASPDPDPLPPTPTTDSFSVELVRSVMEENRLLREQLTALTAELKALRTSLAPAATPAATPALAAPLAPTRKARRTKPAKAASSAQPELPTASPPSAARPTTASPEAAQASTSRRRDDDGMETADAGFTKVTSKKRKLPARDQPARTNPDASPDAPAAPKIPPIVLHSQEDYTRATLALQTARVQIHCAKATSTGVVLTASSVDDFRAATSSLEAEKIPFHSFQLANEKPLKIVFRGVPTAPGQEDWLKAELTRAGFEVTSATRMRSSRGLKRPFPMVLVHLPKTDANKEVFNLTSVGHLRVRVESLKVKTSVSQCHRCQLFGHSQSNCRAAHRCVKCSGAHPSSTCTKTRDSAATCCNCNGAHPASYQGCPSNPRNRVTRQKQPTSSSRPARPAATPVSAGLSYAKAAAAASAPSPQPKTPDSTLQNLGDISASDLALAMKIIKVMRMMSTQ